MIDSSGSSPSSQKHQAWAPAGPMLFLSKFRFVSEELCFRPSANAWQETKMCKIRWNHLRFIENQINEISTPSTAFFSYFRSYSHIMWSQMKRTSSNSLSAWWTWHISAPIFCVVFVSLISPFHLRLALSRSILQYLSPPMTGSPALKLFGYQTLSAVDATFNQPTHKANKTETSQAAPREKTNEFNKHNLFWDMIATSKLWCNGHVSKYQCWYTSWFVLPPAATKCPGTQQTMQATISYGPCHGFSSEMSIWSAEAFSFHSTWPLRGVSNLPWGFQFNGDASLDATWCNNWKPRWNAGVALHGSTVTSCPRRSHRPSRLVVEVGNRPASSA